MIGHTDALSALEWWREAGVDTLVEDEPRDWLRAAAKAAPAAPPPPAESELPATLASFHLWLRDSDALPGAPAIRLLPAGDAAAGLMFLTDMPDAADAAAGALFHGQPGRLFDRMLGAIGRDRASIYLAAMAGARVSAREIEAPELARIARRHVALAAPRALLLLGNAPSRALLGMDFASARGRRHEIPLEGTSVTAIATFPPRMLLQQPARKADAWADLQLLLEVLSE